MVKAVRALRMDDLLAGMIRPARFPELHFIMWDQRDTPMITPELAHALYRDRWSYVHEHRMLPKRLHSSITFSGSSGRSENSATGAELVAPGCPESRFSAEALRGKLEDIRQREAGVCDDRQPHQHLSDRMGFDG